MSRMCELNVDFRFTESERTQLCNFFETRRSHPYQHYDQYISEITECVDKKHDGIPRRFVDFCIKIKDNSPVESSFIFVENAPIDSHLPIFDHKDPVKSKHELKRTFVAEGYLALFAAMTGQHPIAYKNVNDGDVFQDIYPKEALFDSQSQKALGPIYFHKDLANHFVRPDYVNILCLRASAQNLVYTTFVRNCDVLRSLDEETLAVMREVEFFTPFDDLTTKSGNVMLGKADNHPALSGDYDLRYFENRTIGLTERAKKAVEKITKTVHAVKKRVHMQSGDFVCIYNNFSVHGKEILAINDPASHPYRWMVKTVNVDRLEDHARHMVAGTNYLVNG